MARLFRVLRTRNGRRVLIVVLFAALGVVAWWYLGRMPADGTVEVHWTESAPAWISITYIDAGGQAVRWHREDVRPGTDQFVDRYKLIPGSYWLRLELRQGAHLRTIRQRVDLPTSQPYVLFLEELPDTSPR